MDLPPVFLLSVLACRFDRARSQYNKQSGSKKDMRMKSRFVPGPSAVSFFAMLSVPLYANDWINSGSTISNSGNVGIGVAGPTSRLQVETDGSSGSPGAYPSISPVHFLSWAGDGPSSETGIALFRFSAGRVNTTDPNASRALVMEVTTDDKRVFGIRGNGYLGIGTNNPLLPLDVRGRAAIAGATAGQEALMVDQTAASGAILNLRQGGNSKVIVDNAGNVGIGIQAPESRLHVESEGSAGNPGNYPSAPLVQFTSWASDGPSSETGIAMFRFNAARVATADPNSSRALVLEVANDDKRILGIRGNGNVGIGTNLPQVPLDVRGRAVIAGASAGQEALIVDQTAASGAILSLRQGGSGKFLVDNAGYVGIGSSAASPQANLDVGGESILGNLKAGYTTGAPIAGAYIGFKGTSGLSNTGFAVAQFANGTTAINAPPNGRINIGIGGYANGITVDGVNGVQTVGDLKVGGTLRVGTVVATNWQLGQVPDYVFEEDYELASLDHVERFIGKHKHLPDIPSAKEVKEKGLDLGEMNMKLLRKVEELTLYSIRQQKEIAGLKERLDRVESSDKGRK